MDRKIIHLDIAAFAIAVERVREPRLRGRPVLIAPGASRARVLSLSEEAAASGLRRGQSLDAAIRICKDAVVLEPDEPLYVRAAAAVRKILSSFTPLVEPVGYGRAFLDVTGTERLFGAATDLAARVQREVRGSLRLPASAGVAINKLVSRLAADESVPSGLLEIRPGNEAPFLAPMPVRRLPGIAPAVSRDLEDLNIRIVRQLAEVSIGHLTLAFGRLGIVLHERALGVDPSPVLPPEKDDAIVEEARLPEDTVDTAELAAALRDMVERAGRRLRCRKERAGRLDLALRYADDRSAAGRRQLAEASDLDDVLFERAVMLLEKVRKRRVRVRGMTLRCGAIERAPRQMRLFDEEPLRRQEALASALDRLRSRGAAVFTGRERFLRPLAVGSLLTMSRQGLLLPQNASVSSSGRNP